MVKYYDRCWNPIFGCRGNFTGCDKCFAKSLLQRRKENFPYPFTSVSINKNQYKKKFDTKPQLIAVCTQSDLFQDDVKENAINGVLRKCNNINYNHYLFLTKYSENMKKYFNEEKRYNILKNNHINNFSFKHLMFGVTVCCNNDLHRIEDLKQTKLIEHRFVAFEPVYEKINLDKSMLENIEWIIVGAQTGDNATPCQEQWLIDIVSIADEMNIPVFVNAIHTEEGKVTTDFADMDNRLHFHENPFMIIE